MTTQDNGWIVNHVLQALVTHQLDSAREYIAPDIVYHVHAYGKVVRGREEFIAFLENYYGRVEDFRSVVDETLVAGDSVAIRGSESYVMNGQKISFPYASWARLRDGRIVEWDDFFDSRTIGKQLKAGTATAVR